MNTSIAPETNVSEVARDPSQFRVEPPADIAFFEGSRAEIVADDSRVDVHWVPERPVDADTRAKFITGDVVARLRRLVEKNPDSAAANANLGLMLLRYSDKGSAESYFNKALKLDPSNYGALMGLARLAIAANDLAAAERCYRQVLQEHVNDAGALIGIAHVAREAGDLDKALDVLRSVSERDSRAAFVSYEIGMVLLKQGHPKEAIAHFREAAHQDIRSPKFNHALGVAYVLVGELQRAKRSFQTALNLAPGAKDTVLSLAKVLIRLGELEPARELLREGIGAVDDDDTREALAESLLDAGKISAAKAHLVKLAAKLGHDPVDKARSARILNNLAVTVARLDEDLARAEQLYREAIRLAPASSAIPYRNLAGIYLNTGRTEAARDVLARCVSLYPSDPESRWVYSSVLAEAGDVRLAIENARSYGDVYGDSPDVLSILGGLHADELEDLEGAIQIMERARGLFPGSSKVANNLAYVYLLAGNSDKAREVLAGSYADEPVDTAVWTATKGLLELVEGRLERGTELYEEAIKIAFQHRNRRLAQMIRQKMFLELSRARLRSGDAESAKRLATRGLAVKGGRRGAHEALERILHTDKR